MQSQAAPHLIRPLQNSRGSGLLDREIQEETQ